MLVSLTAALAVGAVLQPAMVKTQALDRSANALADVDCRSDLGWCPEACTDMYMGTPCANWKLGSGCPLLASLSICTTCTCAPGTFDPNGEEPASITGSCTGQTNGPCYAHLSTTQRDELMVKHNEYRAQHGACPLTWSQEIADFSISSPGFVATCSNNALTHNDDPSVNGDALGENLAAQSGTELHDYIPADGVQSWYCSEEGCWDYDQVNTVPSNGVTGHMTAVLWKDTMEVGCALCHNNNGELWTSLICNYRRPGNYIPRGPGGPFETNVGRPNTAASGCAGAPEPTPEPTPATPMPTPATPMPTPATPMPTPATPMPTPATPMPTPATPMPTEPTPAPTPVPRYEVGCFKSNTRFLTQRYGWTTNTLDLCAGECARLGHKYAGVEYGSQCWCGDSMAGTEKTVGTECEARMCNGDSSEFCGGAYRVRVFSLEAPSMQPAAEEVGCFAVDNTGRNLDELEFTSSANTVEECTSVCEWNGFKYAGLEYRDECWCGNTLPAERIGGSECSLSCAGDASQMCGHVYKASVYVVDGSSVAVPTSTYEGCFTDTVPRTLPVKAFSDTTGMTVEKCVAVCGHNGYAFAGLQLRKECWCGDSLPTEKLSERNCRMSCSGDNSQKCGYSWRNSVYSITA